MVTSRPVFNTVVALLQPTMAGMPNSRNNRVAGASALISDDALAFFRIGSQSGQSYPLLRLLHLGGLGCSHPELPWLSLGRWTPQHCGPSPTPHLWTGGDSYAGRSYPLGLYRFWAGLDNKQLPVMPSFAHSMSIRV